MKQLNFSVLALSFAFIAISANMKAQDAISDNHDITISIPSVSILDIEPSAAKSLIMDFTAPTEAGLPIANITNNTLWLNYSSIKTSTVTSRHISVKLDTLIPGIDIKVAAAAPTGGAGTLGGGSAQVTLTGTDQPLISGIGSAYTDDGSGKGHNLTYTISPNGTTYAGLTATAAAVANVTYTFVDN